MATTSPNQTLNPFLLAALTPDPDPRLLPLLRSDPHLASLQDSHGYSLLHAATSYNHLTLLRALVTEFHVDVNLRDEDGETCLFVAETVEVARCLVEELGVDLGSVNDEEGWTAAEKITSEGEYGDVAEYLVGMMGVVAGGAGGGDGNTVNGIVSSTTSLDLPIDQEDGVTNGLHHPPPVPPNMNISFNSTTEDQLNGVEGLDPDPDFRRRIEELASRENFNTEEGQRDLRMLITDAVRGTSSGEREVRQRVN